ncbi:MAG: recombinase family protein [Clostridia bacterium]|nr:recombinase family protein [Clostridia bacterium]
MSIALYARKSIERENSISCETQLEYCKSMIKPDEQAEKVVTFVDNGFSGGNVDRDGFQKMMRQVEQGKISKIIVYRLDRISRSMLDFLNIWNTLKKYNVEFVSSQEAIDTSGPYGEMLTKIIMIFAEFERQSIIERVTQAYAHRSEMGFYMGGRKPYGFTLTDTVIHNIKTKMLSPIPDEIEQLKYIFEAYAVPGITLRRLMDNLVQNNILPTVGSWSTGKLSTILKNPIYVKADNDVYEYLLKYNTNIISDISEFDGVHGLQIYGKTKHSADDWSDMKAVIMSHEGIINSDVWLNCQKKLEKNKQIGNAISNTTSWLGGKIVCKSCGRTMTVTKGGKRKDGSQTRYFSCTGKSHNRICKGTNKPIYADSMENMVYELVSEKLETLKCCRKKISTDNSNKINLLKNRISEIKKSQEKLVNLLMNDTIEADMINLLNERAKKLAEEKTDILAKIDVLENEESEIISAINLSKKWRTASYEERKSVCNILIHKILINEAGNCEVVWNI